MLRRSISVLLYVIGGMMLLCEATIAFATPDRDWRVNFGMVGVFVLLAVVPIGLGALVSPGRRAYEVGLVILLGAGAAALMAAMVAYMAVMPDARGLFPPGTLTIFGGYWVGIANLIFLGALGYALYRKGSADPHKA